MRSAPVSPVGRSTALTPLGRIPSIVSRSIGVVEAVHSIVPEEAALALGLLTQLGDIWFLLAVVVLAYWLRPSDRDRTAVVLAIAIGTIALLQGLKGLFGLPRPATPLANADAYPVVLHGLLEATSTAGGHGFPSGHATLSTAVLLGLAGALRIGEERQRVLIATGVIAAVSASRILLGVHFLVDVVAGVLIGLAVLAGMALALETSPRSPATTAFGLAVGLGAISVALTAPSAELASVLADPAYDPALSLGAALGAFAGWQCAEAFGSAETVGSGIAGASGGTSRLASSSIGVVLVLLGAGVLGVVLGDVTFAAAGWVGLLFAGIVALPAVVPGFDATVAGVGPRWLVGEAERVEG